jgi:hypothetical protein
MNISTDLWVLTKENTLSPKGFFETGVVFNILGVFDSPESAFAAVGMDKLKWKFLVEKGQEVYFSETIKETDNDLICLSLYKTKLNQITLPVTSKNSGNDLTSPSVMGLLRKLG